MQIFLPYANVIKSLECLDNKRLCKQRVEAKQIINIYEKIKNDSNIKIGWKSHPVVSAFKEYQNFLKYYYNMSLIIWMNRGGQNIKLTLINYGQIENPWWLGNEDFHRAMRARLIFKKEEFYLPLFPDDKDFNNSKYFWPVNETKTFRII